MAKYGRSASKNVESAMRRRKRGTLKSGGSGRTVKSRKQAIAIGLNEAREKGAKVPSRGSSRKSSRAASSRKTSRTSSARKSGGRKSSGRASTARKSTARKSTARKSAARKSTARKSAKKR
jgi:hypothetical protein